MIYYNYSIVIICFTFIIALYFLYLINESKKKAKAIILATKKSGLEIARDILDENGLKNIYVIENKVFDQYDFNRKVIRLTTNVFDGNDIYSLLVSAYYATVAICDNDGNKHVKIYFSMINTLSIGALFGYIGIMLAFLVQDYELLFISSLLLGIYMFFQLSFVQLNTYISEVAIKKIQETNNFSKEELSLAAELFKSVKYQSLVNILFIPKIFYNMYIKRK